MVNTTDSTREASPHPAVSAEERLAAREEPSRRPCGYHRWHDLTFLHWRLPAEEIQPLLPAGLTLDTWDGDAWVGLVPFFMSGVRPWWSPPVPGVSRFAETNVRTYVHFRGRNPGVWFFSLDAASSLAVRIARRFWNLNYFRARMKVTRDDHGVLYASERLWPEPAGATSNVRVAFDDTDANGTNTAASKKHLMFAKPGTLEFFLAERYFMYMTRPDHGAWHNNGERNSGGHKHGGLRIGRVWHSPYPLRRVRLEACEESLLASSGISTTGPPCHAAYSPGVRVKVYSPQDVA